MLQTSCDNIAWLKMHNVVSYREGYSKTLSPVAHLEMKMWLNKIAIRGLAVSPVERIISGIVPKLKASVHTWGWCAFHPVCLSLQVKPDQLN